MNIGILTFHRADNYGAFLQAYALRSYLMSKRHKVDLIDYWPYSHESTYGMELKGCFTKRAKLIFSYLLSYTRKRKRERTLKKNQSKFLGLPSNVSFRTLESMDALEYDAVFYGSDQIWWKSTIENYKGFDPVYWGYGLSRVKKKICYAPSMGIINLNGDDLLFIKRSLGNFDRISVREEELKSILSDLINKQIPVVTDPTFLMDKRWWNKQCKVIRHPSKYVLLFNLCKSKETELLAKQISQITSIPVLEVTGSVFPLKFLNVVQTADAFQFLYLVKNASYVVTSSFHGTVFSVIFQKQFYCAGFGKKSGRVQNLLNILGLQDRYIDGIFNKMLSPVDYNKVDLRNYINNSIEYIDLSLNNEES